MKTLQGKAIIVTGAGRGLGRSYALHSASVGAAVVVNDIDWAAASSVVEEIKAAGGTAVGTSDSVTDPAGAVALIDLCLDRYGAVDGLVNNAGLFHVCPSWDEDPARAERLIAVNLMGTLLCGLAAMRPMRARGKGVILNVTSGAQLGMRGMSSYGASKGGVASLTYSWAVDLADSGVRVSGLSPIAYTRMSTEMGLAPDNVEPPDRIAPLAAYLLSDAAAHLHGKIVRLARGELSLMEPPRIGQTLGSRPDWDIASIGEALAPAPPEGGKTPLAFDAG